MRLLADFGNFLENTTLMVGAAITGGTVLAVVLWLNRDKLKNIFKS